MVSRNNESAMAFPPAAALAHTPARHQNAAESARPTTRKSARQFATVLFCAGVLSLDLGAWKMFPSEQEIHARNEALASGEIAEITKVTQASLADSKHPLLAAQAREARQKIEQAEVRMQADAAALDELRAARTRLIYLFCGIGLLLTLVGALVRLSA